MPTLERVIEGCVLGEAPHWDVTSQSLYLVDIIGKSILKYSTANKKVTKVALDKQATLIVPVEGKTNQFVVSFSNELAIISWDGESDKISVIENLATTETPNKFFNDGKCDSAGRLWAGAHILAADFMKSDPLGSLYVFDTKRQLKSQVDEIRVANGLAFNDATEKMYFIDSLKRTVDQFDFDVQTGTVSNRQDWLTLEKFNIPGVPDGMTIDTDGNLWVAIFGGGRILKVAGNKPETLLDTIELPTEQVTSLAFGGPNLDELYVTTGAMEIAGKKLSPPIHGATYRITGTGSKGFPGINFKWN